MSIAAAMMADEVLFSATAVRAGMPETGAAGMPPRFSCDQLHLPLRIAETRKFARDVLSRKCHAWQPSRASAPRRSLRLASPYVVLRHFGVQRSNFLVFRCLLDNEPACRR